MQQVWIETHDAAKALEESRKELTGPYDIVDSDFLVEFSEDMRKILEAYIYHHWTVIEPNYFEFNNTMKALNKALNQKGYVNRKKGTGTKYGPSARFPSIQSILAFILTRLEEV